MSKYSFRKDFRDFLTEVYNDNWEDFKKSTNCILYKEDNRGQLQLTHVISPVDLIPLYPYVVLNCTENIVDNTRTIYLSYQSSVDSIIDMMEDLNFDFESEVVDELFPTELPRELKVLLYDTYKKYKDKIIDYIV